MVRTSPLRPPAQRPAWIDEVAEARSLQQAGIDGITTDFPDRLLALFEA